MTTKTSRKAKHNGNMSHLAKLTDEQVRWARRNRNHLSQTAMARELKVSQATISNLLLDKIYKRI